MNLYAALTFLVMIGSLCIFLRLDTENEENPKTMAQIRKNNTKEET